jgi:hypothetical protein
MEMSSDIIRRKAEVVGRPLLNPSGPMTSAERSAKYYAQHRKWINQRRRAAYKLAKKSKATKRRGDGPMGE